METADVASPMDTSINTLKDVSISFDKNDVGVMNNNIGASGAVESFLSPRQQKKK